MNRFEDWLESLYDFIFILAVCIFGYVVQIGYMYLKDKALTRKKAIVLFIVNLSISYFLNKVMLRVGWQEWIWIAVWFYNANSLWLLEVIGKKLKKTAERVIPGIVEGWADKLKPKSTTTDNDDTVG